MQEVQKAPVHSCLGVALSGSPLRWETVDLLHRPTFVILDIGCTRAMGSRPAIERFAKAAKLQGVTCEFLPSDGSFNFANSQSTQCKEKRRVWIPTDPPTWTDFDICEEGTVPMLFSLTQMRNLRFKLEMSPEAAYLTCPTIGRRIPILVSTTHPRRSPRTTDCRCHRCGL